ncbi:hypothetical protein LGK97_08280 [Clostridium sp. CS001]|uniref:hypothetical protein n=1 Tax=Clostridium sp. CS001 TaxID=2880648 RepID=UPI001CF0F2D9|nr:hypothetical protein [Clostridium sp. CS001]MCB2289761.1 hypothetical protein [Clostridium sp. CS001]
MKLYKAYYFNTEAIIQTESTKRGYKAYEYIKGEDLYFVPKEALEQYKEDIEKEDNKAFNNFVDNIYNISKERSNIIPQYVLLNGGEDVAVFDRRGFKDLLQDITLNPTQDFSDLLENSNVLQIDEYANYIQPCEYLEVENKNGEIERLELVTLDKDINIRDVAEAEDNYAKIAHLYNTLKENDDDLVNNINNFKVVEIENELYISLPIDGTNVLIDEAYLRERIAENDYNKDGNEPTVGGMEQVQSQSSEEIVQDFEELVSSNERDSNSSEEQVFFEQELEM